MKLDDVLPQLEQLSEAESDLVLAAAGADRTYRLQCIGLFLAVVAAIGAFSLAVPRLYQAINPSLYARLALAAVTLVAIWLAVKLIQCVIQHFYSQAIARHIDARAA